MLLIDALTQQGIILDRSALELFMACPLQCKLDQDAGDRGDADADRPANVGTEFHRVMADYVTELLHAGERHNTDSLKALAVAGDARYQPELLHLAQLTGPRISIWIPGYIGHEVQCAYELPNFGPAGETVKLTCRMDYVKHGYGPGEIHIMDWKTGWGKSGFDFQAMFYAVVAWRKWAETTRVIWQPFHCRFGTLGKPHEFDEAALAEAEMVIKQAAMQYLQEEDWSPSPGMERCRWCRFQEKCDAERRFSEIDEFPVDFANATLKMKAEIKSRMAALKAYVKAHGPIQTDDGWWGVNVISLKPQFKLNKGTPGFLGEDEEENGDD